MASELLFGGLQAWFSINVPNKYLLLWEKHGGLAVMDEHLSASLFPIVFGLEEEEVAPDWIVDCVHQGKLLAWQTTKRENGKPCLLSAFKTPPKQKKHSCLFESISLDAVRMESHRCFDWNFEHTDFVVVQNGANKT